MAIHIIMDHTGDARHEFDVADASAVALAKERFEELVSVGFRAVALAKDGGSARLLKEFAPEVEETLFIPQLRGG